MRFALLMLIPFALFSCNRESVRKLTQKMSDSLGHEASHSNTEGAPKEKPAKEQVQKPASTTTSPNPASQGRPHNMQQALQQLEGQRRAQEKGFSDQIPPTGAKPTTTPKPKPGSSTTAKPKSSYQGFPGFEK